MQEKQTPKERMREITDSIEQGIRELFQSDKYKTYLKTMSRFHKYSVNNVMLIYMQKPDATLVAGYNKWQDGFGRHVKKGEHGLMIIAPTPYKKQIETQVLDPDTKVPLRDKTGALLTETKVIEIPSFRPVRVFDVSQTEGRPLPQLAESLHGNVKNFELFMEALKRSAPVPMAFEGMPANTDGYFSPSDQRIAIREGMSEVQTVSAAVHEITHSKLHNQVLPPATDSVAYQEIEIFGRPALFSNGRLTDRDVPTGLYRYDLRGSDEDPGLPLTVERTVTVNHAASILTARPLDLPDNGRRFLTEDEGMNFTGRELTTRQFMQQNQKDRRTQEIEAESVSYSVCQYYGIETQANSFGYLAGWSSGKDLAELKASLQTINRTANELITEIDRNFREICKERGIDLTGAQKTPLTEQEKAFLSAPGDSFALYQIRNDDPGKLRFMNYDWLQEHGIPIDRANYQMAYSAPLTVEGSADKQLETLYAQFNLSQPADFRGPSMSVSDIVVLKQKGVVSCHYTDSVGFRPVAHFLDNPLKNAEISLEDDYGMIDGIINNGKKEAIPDRKPSVVDLLKEPKPEHHRQPTKPKKNMEMEI